MKTSTVIADASMLALSILFGAGSIVMFILLSSAPYFSMGWPDSYALPWNAALSLAFFVQHSGMVRRPVRARLAAFVPARYQGALYSIASGAVLALVVVLWQPSATEIYGLHGIARWAVQALSILAAATFVLSAVALRGSFDPLGIGPIRAHLRGRAAASGPFVLRGPYLWVRHPLYSCVLVLLWANPVMTADRLLLAILWTAWIVVGAMLEERDLVAEFGDAYRVYRGQVPMLIPWRGRHSTSHATSA